jgi:hypothetical protein
MEHVMYMIVHLKYRKAFIADYDDVICSLDNLGLINFKSDRMDKAQELDY